MIRPILTSFVILFAVAPAMAQDPPALVEYYGDGVHAYYAGDVFEAHRLLTQAIDGGIQDPRAFYFRAMTLLTMGRHAEAKMDMEAGAYLEARAPSGAYAVDRSIQRLQGHHRLQLEKIRRRVRFNVEQQRRQEEQLRYEETQQREADILRPQQRGMMDELVEPAGGARRDPAEGRRVPPPDPGRTGEEAAADPVQPRPAPPARDEGVQPPTTDEAPSAEPETPEIPDELFPTDGADAPAEPADVATPDEVVDDPFGGTTEAVEPEGAPEAGAIEDDNPFGTPSDAPPTNGSADASSPGATSSGAGASLFRSLGQMIGRGLSGQGPEVSQAMGGSGPAGAGPPPNGAPNPFGGQAEPFDAGDDPFSDMPAQGASGNPFGDNPFGESSGNNGGSDEANPFGANEVGPDDNQASPFGGNGGGNPFE